MKARGVELKTSKLDGAQGRSKANPFAGQMSLPLESGSLFLDPNAQLDELMRELERTGPGFKGEVSA